MLEKHLYYQAASFLRLVSTLVKSDSSNNIIDVTCADPLQEPPEIAIEALRAGIAELRGRYPDYSNLKESCADYYKRHGVAYCSQNNIYVDTSSLTIIAKIFAHKTFLKNKKVLIPTPTFGHYIDIINPTPEHPEYDILFCSASKESGYRLNIKKLEEDIKTNSPGVLLLVNPVNPSGTVYTADELKEIARICTENGIFVICDEIFADTLSPKNEIEIPSIASFMDPSQLFASSGIGKSFGYPDARVSWVFGNPENIETVFPRNLSGSISSLSAKAVKAILCEGNQEEILKYREESSKIFYSNMKLIEGRLLKINKSLSEKYGETKEYIKFIKPEATTVALLDFSSLADKDFLGYGIVKSGLDIAYALLEQAQFATVPGEASMISPADMICRISIADHKKLAKGFDNLQKAIEGRIVPTPVKSRL